MGFGFLQTPLEWLIARFAMELSLCENAGNAIKSVALSSFSGRFSDIIYLSQLI
jgi:hypothetical protein